MDRLELTRRQLLGTAAFALGAGRLGAGGPASVAFRQLSGTRAVLELNGERAWQVDAAWFGGSPRLAVSQQPDRLRVSLEGALYPGTALPADLELDLTPPAGQHAFPADGNLADATLTLRFSGAEATGLTLGAWLAGEAPARLTVNLGGSTCAAAGDCALSLGGKAAAELAPDWSLTLTRSGLATLNAEGEQLKADRAVFSLQPGRATRISLARGERHWPVLLPAAHGLAGQLTGGKRMYDTAHLDLVEGSRPARLTLESAQGALVFHPAGGLEGKDGKPLAYPLTQPRYTITFGSEGTERSLTAAYGPERVWAMAGDAVLLLGATPETPAFAWTERPDRPAPAVAFHPAALSVAAGSMNGLVVQVASAGAPAAVSLSAEGTGLDIALDRLEIVRPEDMLCLTFSFTGLKLQAGGGSTPQLVPVSPGTPGEMTVAFPGQHIAEEAVYDGIPARAEPAPPIASRLAGPSTLKFRVLAGAVDFSLEALLNWQPESFELLEGAASQLEIPYRLFMQVPGTASWIHSTTPVADGKRTELWHTRVAEPLQVRYTTPDVAGGRGDFLTSLTPTNRWQIADRTTNRSRVDVPHLMLSALGAWMSARGSWTVAPADANPLEFWSHHMAMGRDIKVVVVQAGYLLPFGQKASMITVSERKFQRGRAYLRQKTFIVVRQPEKVYDKHDMPLNRVELRTLVTPTLDLGSFDEFGPFWVKVGGVRYPFHVVGEDKQGRPCEFLMPMAWASTARQAEAVTFYNSQSGSMRVTQLQGQAVAYAPGPESAAMVAAAEDEVETTTQSQTTVLDTLELQFKLLAGQSADGLDALEANFRAEMEKAKVRVPAVEQFAETGGAVEIAYHEIYKAHQFQGQNPWQIFAKLLDAGKQMKLPAGQNGGVVMPSFNLKALSRKFGPTGIDPKQIGDSFNNSFDPSAFFSSFAKLLGAIDFSKILNSLTNVTTETLREAEERGRKIVPEFNIEIVSNKSRYNKSVDRSIKLTLGLDLTAAVSPDKDGLKSSGVFVAYNDEDATTAVKLNLFLQRDLGSRDIKGKREQPNPVDFGLSAAMEHFGIALGPLTINFDLIEFEVGTAGVGVEIQLSTTNPFNLGGPLQAVGALAGNLPTDIGAGDPGEVEEEEGITVGIEVPLNNLPKLGAFEIRALKPWFYVTLPLSDGPITFETGVSERDDPFLMVLYIGASYGLIGGGFFGIKFTPQRVTDVELMIEVGGFFGFSAGIAKGEVTARVGLYLHLALGDGGGTEYEVTGFVRITGEISIKIFELFIELYLAMSYYSAGDYWKGTARLSVSLSIGFISLSFSVTVERRFDGGNSASAARLAEGEGRRARRSRQLAAYCGAFCQSYA